MNLMLFSFMLMVTGIASTNLKASNSLSRLKKNRAKNLGNYLSKPMNVYSSNSNEKVSEESNLGQRINSISDNLNQFFLDKKSSPDKKVSTNKKADSSKDDINYIRPFRGNPSPNFGSKSSFIRLSKRPWGMYDSIYFDIHNLEQEFKENVSVLHQFSIENRKYWKKPEKSMAHQMPSSLLIDDNPNLYDITKEQKIECGDEQNIKWFDINSVENDQLHTFDTKGIDTAEHNNSVVINPNTSNDF